MPVWAESICRHSGGRFCGKSGVWGWSLVVTDWAPGSEGYRCTPGEAAIVGMVRSSGGGCAEWEENIEERILETNYIKKSEVEEPPEEGWRKGQEVWGAGGESRAGSQAGLRPRGQKKGALFSTHCGDSCMPTWKKSDASLPYFLYQNKFQAD